MIEAFSYMFKDSKFFQKAGWYFVFLFVSVFLSQYAATLVNNISGTESLIQYIVYLVLGFLINLIPVGYSYLCIKALMMQKDNYILPFFNAGKSFVMGLKFCVNMIIQTGIFYLPFILLVAIGVVIGILGGKTVMAIMAVLFLLLLFIYLIFLIAYFILLCIYMPALSGIFAKTEWLTSFCRFKRATKLIQQDAGTYFKGVGIYVLILIAYLLVYGIFSFITTILLGKTIISALLIALLGSIVSSYLVFVFSYIVVAAIKHETIE